MPGVNDTAEGYDVNRIIQALNGTNLVPITIGNLTVSGTLNVSDITTLTKVTTAGALQLESGNSSDGHEHFVQVTFGWGSATPLVQYQHFLTTEHLAGGKPGNKFRFWTGDGTQNGVFPTNAVLGLTIENATITVPGTIFSTGGVGLDVTAAGGTTAASGTVLGDKISMYSSGTHGYGFGIQGSRLVAYVDSNAGTYFAVREGSGSGNASSNSTNEILIGPPDAVILGPANFQLNSYGGDIYVSGNSSNAVVLRPTRNSGTGQWILGGSDGHVIQSSYLSMPPSAGGTVAPTSYGTVPVKIAEFASGGSLASADFQSIPGGFRHLVIEFSARSDQAVTVQECGVQFNGDTSGGHYVWERSTVNAGTPVAQDGGTGAGSITHIYIPGASASSGSFATYRIEIPNYSHTTPLKSLRASGGYFSGASFPLANVTSVETIWGSWVSTAAITEVKFFPAAGNFVFGSVFTLYGIP